MVMLDAGIVKIGFESPHTRSNVSEVSRFEMFVISFCEMSMFSLRSTVSSVLLLLLCTYCAG